MLGYESDFFATNEREIAFVKWMRINRPRHHLHVARFPSLTEAGATASALAKKLPDLKGLFVVWDTPAIAAAAALVSAGVCSDRHSRLGKEAAISLSGGRAIVTIAAQQPFRQGRRPPRQR